MIYAKAFVKSTRQAARARLLAAPAWWKQYKKARGGWKYYLLISVIVFVIATLVPFLLIGVPFMGGVGVAKGGPATMRVGLALAATVNAAIMFGHGAFLMRELLVSRTLAVSCLLPISDKAILSNRAWVVFKIALLNLLICISFFVALAVFLEGKFENRLIIGLMAVVEWLVVVAFTFITPAFFPRLARQDSVGGMIGLAFLIWMFSGIAAGMGFVQPDSVALFGLIALPTGWPMLLLELVAIDGNVLGWFLLLPVAFSLMVMWLAFRRMRRLYVVKEISMSDNTMATAVLAPEFEFEQQYSEYLRNADEDESLVDRDSRFSIEDDDRLGDDTPSGLVKWITEWLGVVPAPSEEVELTPAEARVTVRSREFLQPLDWSSYGWLENTLGNTLREEEKMTAELMHGGEPRWTRRQATDLIMMTSIVLLMLMVQLFWGLRILAMAGHLAFFGFFAMMRGSWPAAIWRASTGHVSSISGLVPVHQKDMNRAVMVLGVARCVLFLPFAMGLAITAVYGFTGEVDVPMSLYIGAKVTLLLLAIHMWWPLGLQPHGLTQPLSAIFRDSLIGLGLIFTAIAGAVCLFVARTSELWSAVSALFLFGPGWVFQRWQHKRLLQEPIDFVTTRTNQREAVRRQQEIVNKNW